MDNAWLKDLKPDIKRFLKHMSENNFSYFKYSFSGDTLDSSKEWGLANLVFAAKILYITGLMDEIEEIKKENLYKSIMKFSTPDGYISDPYIVKWSLYEKLKIVLLKRNSKEDIKRAETRQSFAALHSLEKKPSKPFLFIPYDKEGIENYLSSYDWSDPWRAGGNFSHLLFFLNYNSKYFDYKTGETKELIRAAVNWISKIQSREDGTWYMGSNIPLNQKINGALKLIIGLHAAEIYDFPYPKKLIDTALSGINDEGACDHFNIVYTLYGGSLIEPDYRKDEIQEFLFNRIRFYHKHYHPDKGGFSFYVNMANKVYLSKKITIGKNEPDIHGTVMFMLGLSIIDKMLDMGLDFKIPLN